MPVFISYSHSDEEFVNKFAAHLVKHNTHVWVDTWNLSIGDSILSKVQEAIEESSALILVLSKQSVESEWCKKELNSALMRELDEKRVIVLPILLEDCNIPLFLREKMYADFRSSFDAGLTSVVDSLARISNQQQSRIASSNGHVDWSMTWGFQQGLLNANFTIIEQSTGAPFTVLSQISIKCNRQATQRYRQYMSLGLDWYCQFLFTTFIADAVCEKDLHLVLESTEKETIDVKVQDSKLGVEFIVKVESSRLGEDTGKDILVNATRYITDISRYVKSVTRDLTSDESSRLQLLLLAR
ncbi:toll/interleukin-1 receptor domain-containing protein [Vibrio alginolyticus]|uniref:toll/interleukin-1 receptor domain-containing protein n=1 Tax=Vibrio TaxID=662 RepID=UPI001CDCA534|nr:MULTISPECIES: toll/interleukin-1 receptor domain-containing protein [Vibrio]MCA2484859.1 toll/interleukin-1 receptor domain-containing protein [Vibrio alginolyticus]MDW2281165.1 toll/interleukin-1 receptor domain-containing protein [Vibrio sp. 1402]